jgi:hypothetical protein
VEPQYVQHLESTSVLTDLELRVDFCLDEGQRAQGRLGEPVAAPHAHVAAGHVRVGRRVERFLREVGV